MFKFEQILQEIGTAEDNLAAKQALKHDGIGGAAYIEINEDGQTFKIAQDGTTFITLNASQCAELRDVLTLWLATV